MGRIGFPGSHLKENVCEAMKAIVHRIPRGWRNIQSVHIKSVDSMALPVFNSLPPEPQSLPSIEDGPKVKRVKLLEVRMIVVLDSILYLSLDSVGHSTLGEVIIQGVSKLTLR